MQVKSSRNHDPNVSDKFDTMGKYLNIHLKQNEEYFNGPL